MSAAEPEPYHPAFGSHHHSACHSRRPQHWRCPRPGAIPLGGGPSPAPRAGRGGQTAAPPNYLDGTDPMDPLVAPINSPETLAKFPPTLVITATRGFAMSAAVYTHTQLVKLGVDAELHVWEGLFNGFMYNADVPESRDVYDVLVNYFDRHLRKAPM
jgi:monoterpene epsilon-lactone hydrolase